MKASMSFVPYTQNGGVKMSRGILILLIVTIVVCVAAFYYIASFNILAALVVSGVVGMIVGYTYFAKEIHDWLSQPVIRK